MLRKAESGTWLPAYVPRSSNIVVILLMSSSMAISTTYGVYRSMLNGLNILPEYVDYFHLNDTTKGVNTAAIFIGGCLATPCSGLLCDRLGRRPTILWGSLIAIASMAIQTAAQNVAMFIVARVLIGFGTAIANIASGTYLSETFPNKWRLWGVSMLNNFYYVGALIIAVITLSTSSWESSWAWRLPSIAQGMFSVFSIAFLPFIPESPRWLAHHGHQEAARLAVALVGSDGNVEDPVSNVLYEQIVKGIELERSQKLNVTIWGILKDPVARRRLLIGSSTGIFASTAGNVIATFYLGAELKTAGITDIQSQLKANIVLNAWCLPCALAGTLFISRWGRKSTAIVTETTLVACLLTIGLLTKKYAEDPDHASKALVYGNVAIMFLFQGVYSVAWTPLFSLYPPEIANFLIRAHTVAITQLGQNLCGTILVLLTPIALQTIGWKMYIINASWDVGMAMLIWCFWVEIKGKSLEEIDTIFDTRSRQPRSIAGAQGERDNVANSTAVEKPPLLGGMRQVLPT
ncbi:general substrate transporter [Trichoderma chlorosporum]